MEKVQIILKSHSAKWSALILISVLAFILHSIPATSWYSRFNAETQLEKRMKEQMRPYLAMTAPELKEEEFEKQLQVEFESAKQNMGPKYEKMLQQEANYLDSLLRNPEGVLYPYGYDSYHWLFFVNNKVQTGKYLPVQVNGHPVHHLRASGEDTTNYEIPLHAKSLYAWHKLTSWALGDSVLATANYFTPVLFSLTLLIFGFILWKLVGFPIATLSILFLAVQPSLQYRFTYGWADTDIYQVLFPGVLLGLFYKFWTAETVKGAAIRGAVALAFTILYGIFWRAGLIWGASFFLAIFLMDGVHALLLKSKQQKLMPILRTRLLVLGISSLSIISTVTILYQLSAYLPRGIARLVKRVVHHQLTSQEATFTGWPNKFLAIGELKTPGFREFIDNQGGWFFILVACAGFLLVIYKLLQLARQESLALAKKNLALQMASPRFWLLSGFALTIGIYLNTQYGRFGHFSLWFLAIFAAYAVTKLPELLKTLNRKPSPLFVPLAALLAIAVSSSLVRDIFTPENLGMRHQVNRGRVELYKTIRDQTPEDALIISGWSSGYWTVFFGDRAVVADNGHFRSIANQYLGKLFIDTNDVAALERMALLNESQFNFIKYLQHYEGWKYPFIESLERSMLDPESNWPDSILPILNQTHMDSLLIRYHKDTSAIYIMTDGNMVKSSHHWGHSGAWNHKLADAARIVRRESPDSARTALAQEFGYSPAEIDSIITRTWKKEPEKEKEKWLGAYPVYVTQQWTPLAAQEDSIYAAQINSPTALGHDTVLMQNLFYKKNKSQLNILYPNGEVKAHFPHRLFALDSLGRLTQLNDFSHRQESIDQYDVILNSTRSQALVMDTLLTKALFTRLHFYHDTDSLPSHYEAIDYKKDMLGDDLILWKVHYDAGIFNNRTKISEMMAEDARENLMLKLGD